ncbi:MAG: zinc-ribbon domain-containing protein [Proteobacteria bacterium]|nr:zinc-ribbon domain-containing protein [Pseudomonadota bacterium]
MIITCGECDSSFVLDDSLIKPSGSKVRCSNCRNIFIVYPASLESTSQTEKIKAPKPVKKAAPVKDIAPKAVEKAAPEKMVVPKDDPDLSKAVAQIVEDELDFTQDELGIDETIMPASKAEARGKEFQDDIAVALAGTPSIQDQDMAGQENVGDVFEEQEEILDFSDFELDMDEGDLPGELSSDDQDLDFEFEEKAVADESDAGLELDLDLSSDDEEELDFSDLELELSDDGPSLTADPTEVVGERMAPASTDTADTVVVADADLDFSDFDMDGAIDDQEPPPMPEPTAVDDLGLGLDSATVEGSETVMIEDELDFSDLERELDGSLDGMDDEPAGVDELDLGEDEVPVESETILMDEDDLDFSEFEFDQDDTKAAGGKTKTPLTEEQLAEEELDFSGLADMLDADEPPPDLEAMDDDVELELDLDGDDTETPEKVEDAGSDEEEELDFSDLENLLDGLDEHGEDHEDRPVEDIKLELDDDVFDDDELDFAPSKGKAKVSADDDMDFSDVEAMLGSDQEEDDDDFDLDLDLGEEEADDLAFEEDELSLALDDDEDSDIELELDLGDGHDGDEVDDDDDDLTASGHVSDEQGKKVTAEEKKKPKKTAKRKAKGKGGLIVKLILLLVLLVLVLFGLYMSKDKIESMTGFVIPVELTPLENMRDSISAMDIPGVSNWVKPVPKDPQGKLLLKTSGITGKIIASEKLGDLFVISGKVQNNYPSTRNSISLVGKLFGQAGKVFQSKLFYAGNIISEDELVTLDEEIIKKRLQNRLGDDGMNAKVRPGQIIPFMVVFTNLAENLTEFSVETGGSFQGAAIK